MEEFSEISSLEATKEMLHHKGHILLADHAQSYLLLSCLEDEMNGKVNMAKSTGLTPPSHQLTLPKTNIMYITITPTHCH